MGDRASATFTVYTCPDQHTANEIMSIAQEYGFGLEWSMGQVDINTLTLSVPFTCHELSLGEDEYLAKRLQELGVVAHVQQDGKYEFDGAVHMTSPILGLFESTGSNGSDGDVLVRAIDIENACKRFSNDVLKAEMLKLTGRAWHDEIDAAMTDIVSGRFPTEFTYDPEHECEKCDG